MQFSLSVSFGKLICEFSREQSLVLLLHRVVVKDGCSVQSVWVVISQFLATQRFVLKSIAAAFWVGCYPPLLLDEQLEAKQPNIQ